MSHEMWSQVKEERDRRGIEGAVERREHEGMEEVLEISGGLGCGKRVHVEVAERLENSSVGMASRGEVEDEGTKGSEIQVSGSTATFLGGSEFSQRENKQFLCSFVRLQNPQKFARQFDAQSLLTVRMHLRRSSACPALLLMLTHLRSLRPRCRHQHSPESWIQYKELTKLWSMRKYFHKDSSHNSGISAQQREQQASELRGSGQGQRRCKLECLLSREQENLSTPRTHRNRSSFRCCTRERRHLKRLAQDLLRWFSTQPQRGKMPRTQSVSSGLLVLANSWLELLLHWVRGWFKDQQK